MLFVFLQSTGLVLYSGAVFCNDPKISDSLQPKRLPFIGARFYSPKDLDCIGVVFNCSQTKFVAILVAFDNKLLENLFRPWFSF